MLDTTPFRCYNKGIRGISTVGSASHSHCEGQGFDSPMLHQNNITQNPTSLWAALPLRFGCNIKIKEPENFMFSGSLFHIVILLLSSNLSRASNTA